MNESNTSANIPLLCGQIVAQLNGLLFLVHGLNQPPIELNLQSQLVAIYTRLQEVVAMVEAAKKQEEENKGIQKTLEKMKENKMKEEESIAKQLQDYQRALLQQHQEAASSQPLKVSFFGFVGPVNIISSTNHLKFIRYTISMYTLHCLH